jgi:drug/metabolite transporter (DMT)-like permease
MGAGHRAAPNQPSTNMSRILSSVILLVGIVLLVYGIDASNSVSSSVTQAVSGTPTNKSIWLIVLGVVGVLSGGCGLLLRRAP